MKTVGVTLERDEWTQLLKEAKVHTKGCRANDDDNAVVVDQDDDESWVTLSERVNKFSLK
jgi:UPF0288 family protein (methanogenesis marker protein 3)